MLSTFFKTKPVVDEVSREWIFDTFSWCIDQLDGEFFKSNSELILPDNKFYPGSSTSVEAMAEVIFANTSKYAGMTSWPIKLVSADNYQQKPMSQLFFESTLRGESCKVANKATVPTIDIAFHSSQLSQPQDLIAYLVQKQASILVSQHGIIAPGGTESLAQTIDLVACFMGFGVIFANTAYQFRGGCGSCNNVNLNRQAALPELETVYALALFSVIKGCDIKPIKKALKSHLYKSFRQAHKEISQYLKETTNPEHSLLSTNFVSH
jgi:hypothetical protein